jgi:RHS repeat-associated protein
MGYDASGRRVTKAVEGTGAMDDTTHYYLSGQSVAETRNGSDLLLEQFVHGPNYVDELVQVAVNSDPPNQTACDYFYWACQDANFNVLGLIDDGGNLAERYEYSAYGQRQVFYCPGFNDPGCFAPAGSSQVANSLGTPLNAFGHQGLMHDEETDLVYNRARMLHPTLGRFMQQDPMGYVDGVNTLAYVAANPSNRRDPSGKAFDPTQSRTDLPGRWIEFDDGSWVFIYTWDPIPKAHVVYVGPIIGGNTDPDTAKKALAVIFTIMVEVQEARSRAHIETYVDWDCFWDYFDKHSSSVLFPHIPFLGGSAGTATGVLTTPYPKPPNAFPKGSGFTNLLHKLGGSNLLKRPFARILGKQLSVAIGRVATKAVPVVGWGLLAWDAIAAERALAACTRCKGTRPP